MAAAGSHLTPGRRESGGGPHGGGGMDTFDDISGGLTTSATHFCLAPLAVSLRKIAESGVSGKHGARERKCGRRALERERSPPQRTYETSSFR
jgi:hypothetical protein